MYNNFQKDQEEIEAVFCKKSSTRSKYSYLKGICNVKKITASMESFD